MVLGSDDVDAHLLNSVAFRSKKGESLSEIIVEVAFLSKSKDFDEMNMTKT